MTSMSMARAAVTALTLAACDDRQALHPPHPSLERMQRQPRVDPFDGRGMEPPPAGAVAMEDPDPVSVEAPPATVDLDLVRQGRTAFDRVCATCHGVLGDGQSVVASRMLQRPPPSLVDGEGGALDRARVLAVIEQGYGLMPSFAHELPPRERWATVEYLEALRLSRGARVASLPADVQRRLASSAGSP